MGTVGWAGVHRREWATALVLVVCSVLLLVSAHLGGAGAGVGDGRPVASPPSVTATTTTTPVPATDCAVEVCVALTFDDGPGPYADQLLDVLRNKGVHATFFVLGSSIERYPDALRRTAAEGHEIGNHTWTHRDLTTLAADEIRTELDSTADLVEQITGTRPTLVRPPTGARNPAVDALVGGPEILWDVDPRDWQTTDSAVVEQRVLEAVQPGSIVLLHDVKPSTVAVVAQLIDELHERGFALVTVSDLLAGTALQPGSAYTHRTYP